MIDRPNTLRKSLVDWLLEESNPSVRYFALRDIVGKPEDDDELIAARRAIPESATIKEILKKQSSEGYWEDPKSPYLPKYKSSYWTIMVLGLLGMDNTSEEVKKACEFIFQFQHDAGGFSCSSVNDALRKYEYRRRKGKQLPPRDEFVTSFIFESQVSCLTGNVAAALIRIGYADDPRVKKALEWLVRVQNKDGGWLCPYWKAHVRDWHGCFMGTICSLEAFSEIPKSKFTEEMKDAASRGAEFLLTHRLFKAEHHNYRVINHAWLEMSFPWFAGYNILRGLDVLTRLGHVKDERLNDAVKALMQKRQNDGKWILENSPTGRMQANIEVKGQPSKWITFIALRVLKRLKIHA